MTNDETSYCIAVSDKEWDSVNERYLPNEDDVKVELYIFPDKLKPIVQSAKYLAHLRELAKEHNFRLFVYPSVELLESLWNDD